MPSSQKRSLAERRRRWELIISGRQRIVENLPHLDGDVSDLESVNKDIRVLAAKQAYYVGKAREVTTKIRMLSKHGDRLRGRIGASLRGKHGFDAADLIQYGFKPRLAKRSPEETPSLAKDPRDDFPGDIPTE